MKLGRSDDHVVVMLYNWKGGTWLAMDISDQEGWDHNK